MKNLSIALALTGTLFATHILMANPAVSITVDESIDTITVVANPHSTDFDIYSLRHAEEALDLARKNMVDSFVVADDSVALSRAQKKTDS